MCGLLQGQVLVPRRLGLEDPDVALCHAHGAMAQQDGHLFDLHLVCVALDASHELAGLFVLTASDLHRFPAGINPYRNNKHILFVTCDGNIQAGVTEQRNAVSVCRELTKQARCGPLIMVRLLAPSILPRLAKTAGQ